jgi:hypothetical protein
VLQTLVEGIGLAHMLIDKTIDAIEWGGMAVRDDERAAYAFNAVPTQSQPWVRGAFGR